MNKILPFFVVGILVCMLLTVPVFPVIGLIDNNIIKIDNTKSNEHNLISFYQPNICKGMFNEKSNAKIMLTNFDNYRNGEVVDQQQTYNCGSGWGVIDTQWVAQGFTPSLDVLTKVQLYMFKWGIVDDIQITVSIRDSLDGDDITNVSVDAFGLEPVPSWKEFDFADINVTPGLTYYIVARAPEADEVNVTCWNFYINNPYKGGDAWCAFFPDFNWFLLDVPPDFPETDCCFMTYGLDDPPNTPIIEGTSEGNIGIEYNYTFTTTDSEGHDVYFYINWGDDTSSGWIGPYSSGQQAIVAHSWDKKGKYIIEAKANDTYGAESAWGTLEVTMQKNKPLSLNLNLLNCLFKRFTHTFPIMRYFLGFST